MSAFTQDEQRKKALAGEQAQAAYQRTLLSTDSALVQDQARARAAESNVRAVAPRYQGTGLAQMFGAQGVASAKTKLGQ